MTPEAKLTLSPDPLYKIFPLEHPYLTVDINTFFKPS